MMKRDKPLYDKIYNAVHTSWDPIGVAEFTNDEYRSYVPKLFDLLNSNSSKKEVFEYLWKIETSIIGLSGNKKKTTEFVDLLYELLEDQ